MITKNRIRYLPISSTPFWLTDDCPKQSLKLKIGRRPRDVGRVTRRGVRVRAGRGRQQAERGGRPQGRARTAQGAALAHTRRQHRQDHHQVGAAEQDPRMIGEQGLLSSLELRRNMKRCRSRSQKLTLQLVGSLTKSKQYWWEVLRKKYLTNELQWNWRYHDFTSS